MDTGGIILGSFLASVFQVLFDKLTSVALDYAKQEGISTTLVDDWKKKLVTINAVINDAENKQLSDNHLVKLWLEDFKNLAYDMEDVLDEFVIQATQVKSGAESSTSKGRVNWQFSCFGGGKSSRLNPNRRSLVSKTEVEKINGRLEEIVTRKDYLNLRENVLRGYNNTNRRLPSTSLLDDQFFGREKEKVEMVKLLTGEVENGDATLCVVPIVGMGGVGKTALAKWLYNNAEVSSCFERMAWVCVSDVFDVLNITKSILQSITELPCEDKDFNWLQVKLKDSLSGKKFLVVLDDVWNEKYTEWTTLLIPFGVGAKGSKIIVTTRNHSVASVTGFSPYLLEGLSVDYCTSLLAFHALGATNFESHPNFEIIGKKIAERCNGLPLAVKVLGGALRNKNNLSVWEDTLTNTLWDLPTVENYEVLPSLKLSYVHLPYDLKRCFSYCAVFPKDYEIERDELVLLWKMEGFLDGQKETQNQWKGGQNYFDELVSRSFLQQSSIDASKFSMHDRLNDLAKSIEGRTCFSSGEFQLAVNEDDASLEKARYASFISSQFVTSKCLRVYHRMKALRSLFLMRGGSSKGSLSISNQVLHDLLTNLKYLRVFSLCHCSIVKVPDCVGNLKHLRYLNFSYTEIMELPESIVSLCKLQALILRGCQWLSILPEGITKLVSLQFLDIRDTMNLKEMPSGINNLKNLIILSKYVVGPEKGLQLKELKNLSRLQGELFIAKLQKVQEVRDALNANLLGKQGLRTLHLQWSEYVEHQQNDRHEAQVLQSLQPHTNLENLTISCYSGAMFPSWLCGPSYSNMVSLCLRHCLNVTSLPPLGQLPSLRELSLEFLPKLSMIGPEFYGGKRSFSSLTTLKFELMLAWEDWSHYVGGQEEEVPFSCLQHLVVRTCDQLVGTLPSQLDHLVKLEIHSCLHLNNSSSKVCLPSLHELYLKDCNEAILKVLVNLTSLTILRIENLFKLVCFDHGFMSCLLKLKELHIISCYMLTYLWQYENEMPNLTFLHELVIESCPQFKSFVIGEEEIELPCNLERMVLSHCRSLEKLPSKMHTLRNLRILGCPKLMGETIPPGEPSNNNLTSFPFAKGRLAALKTLLIWNCKEVKSLEEITAESLNSLHIRRCENLRSLPQYLHVLSHLTHLEIENCPALEIENFPPLPVTLLSLILCNCPKIKSMANCSNLTELEILNCEALEMEDFPPLPTTLSKLILVDCPKIKSLSNQWHQFTSLRQLKILNCQNIKCFPEGGLPPNLQFLEISMCKNLMQPVREWGLPLLTSLMSLSIDGRNMGGDREKVRFPSEDEDEEDAWSLLFPSSLTHLVLENMRNVKRLSSGLRNHLFSLRYLGIFNCPMLRDLPKDGLPPSLHELYIYGCERLRDKCSKHIGNHRHHIQEIPHNFIG